ncbi:hypothetical protein [Arthrobacter sp. EpRS71]|nr:hypothetical protein [Arthrobacter sp. EpRS71]
MYVQSAHFKQAMAELPALLRHAPDIVNAKVDGWSELGEFSVQ